MKQKMKKIFESSIWWSGVVMVGLILGISLQFVRAWTEPNEAPPGGNVGAPINTGFIGQIKQGILQVGGLTVFNDPVVSGVDVTGKVLTAQNANGAVGWAPGMCGFASEIDSEDQPKTTFDDAAQKCRSRGGCWRLPTSEELYSFFGHPTATDKYLFTTSRIDKDVDYGHHHMIKLVIKKVSTEYPSEPSNFSYPSGECDYGWNEHNYRCVR